MLKKLLHLRKADGEQTPLTQKDGISAACMLPIRLTMIYLTFSMLVYAFGPFEWPTTYPVIFYSLLILYMVALWLGYRFGVKKTFSRAIEWKEEYTDKIIGVLSILIVINYLVYVVNIFRDYGFRTPDFPGLFREMGIGIRNPGLGYALRLERVETLQGADVMGGSLFSLFNLGWSFVRYPIVILGMLCFKKLKIWGKIFNVLYLLTVTIFYLSIGTNIDILHVFLLLELPIIVKLFVDWHHRRLNAKRAVKYVACVLAGLMLVACYFTWMMVSRGGVNNYDQPDYNVGGVGLDDSIVDPGEEFDEAGNPIPHKNGIKLPPVVMKFWISFSSYFTQGYYGMSQAKDLPWDPMCGIGNSQFLVDFISNNIYDVHPFTYQEKLDALGWKSGMQWHSMYTWLANDVSFLGVPVIMLLIGLLFGAMFRDAVTSDNPFAKVSVFYFILMMLFIPCNNQIAQRADTLFSFIWIILCWLLTKYPPKWLRRWLEGAKTPAP